MEVLLIKDFFFISKFYNDSLLLSIEILLNHQTELLLTSYFNPDILSKELVLFY